MSICLLCYAFPFYVSAITLARSELSPYFPHLICLVVMYLSPTLPLFFSLPLRPLSVFPLFILFSMSLCPYAIGVFFPPWVFVCV